MPKLSVEITGKKRSGLFLHSALVEQGPEVLDRVAVKARPVLQEGEEPPDLMPQLDVLGQLLETSLDRMVEEDAKLYREDTRRATLLKERDDKAAFLGRKMTGMRRLAQGHYEKPAIAELGFVGGVAREPIALLRQAELICDQLKSEELTEMLGPALFDPPHDLSPYALQLEPVIAEVQLAHQQASGRQAARVEGRRGQRVRHDLPTRRKTVRRPLPPRRLRKAGRQSSTVPDPQGRDRRAASGDGVLS